MVCSVLMIISIKYLLPSGITSILLYSVFCLLNFYIISYLIINKVNKNLIMIILFCIWLVHNSFSFYRLSYMGIFSYDKIAYIYVLMIIATLLIFMGFKFSQTFKVNKGFFFEKINIHSFTFYVLLVITMGIAIYKYSIAGGIVNYISSSYESKVPGNMKFVIFILDGIFSANFFFVAIIFAFNSQYRKTKYIAWLYIIFNLFDIIISGKSSGVLYRIIAMLLFAMISIKNPIHLKKITNFFKPLVVVGLVAGILVRFNRSSDKFSMDMLKDALDTIVISPTFDCLQNLTKIMDVFNPTYTLGQFIYPFVNFLPRAIFPDKPIELGRIIAVEFYGFSSEQVGGFAPSIIGEFYYDFGYLGILTGLLSVGFFLGILQKKFNKTHATFLVSAILIQVSINTAIIPNWYTGWGIRFSYIILFWIVAFSLNQAIRIFTVAKK
nr:O-antigen polymerase [Priestia megaterium]